MGKKYFFFAQALCPKYEWPCWMTKGSEWPYKLFAEPKMAICCPQGWDTLHKQSLEIPDRLFTRKGTQVVSKCHIVTVARNCLVSRDDTHTNVIFAIVIMVAAFFELPNFGDKIFFLQMPCTALTLGLQDIQDDKRHPLRWSLLQQIMSEHLLRGCARCYLDLMSTLQMRPYIIFVIFFTQAKFLEN